MRREKGGTMKKSEVGKQKLQAALQKLENRFPGVIASIQRGEPYRAPRTTIPNFVIGQTVKFKGRKDQTLTGTVKKITRTGRIQIIVPNKSGWWSVVASDVWR
jgi:biotin-(acetyl-CoA carboxylase) ligase